MEEELPKTTRNLQKPLRSYRSHRLSLACISYHLRQLSKAMIMLLNEHRNLLTDDDPPRTRPRGYENVLFPNPA